MDYKKELENRNIILSNCYETYIEKFKELYKQKKQKEQEYNEIKNECDKYIYLIDCVKNRMDQINKTLYKIYNTEEFKKIDFFYYDPEIVEFITKADKPENYTCICGSIDLFIDEEKRLRCRDCELMPHDK
jgi:hypothetical protein